MLLMGQREMADVTAQGRARDLGCWTTLRAGQNQPKEGLLFKSQGLPGALPAPINMQLRKLASGKLRTKDVGDTESYMTKE